MWLSVGDEAARGDVDAVVRLARARGVGLRVSPVTLQTLACAIMSGRAFGPLTRFPRLLAEQLGVPVEVIDGIPDGVIELASTHTGMTSTESDRPERVTSRCPQRGH